MPNVKVETDHKPLLAIHKKALSSAPKLLHPVTGGNRVEEMELHLLSAQLNSDRLLFTASGLSQRLSAHIETLSCFESLVQDDSIFEGLQLLRNNIEALEILWSDPKAVHCSKSNDAFNIIASKTVPAESVNSICSSLMGNVCNPLLRAVFAKDYEDHVIYRLTVEVCLLTAACIRHVDSTIQANLMTSLIGILCNGRYVSSCRLVPVIRILAKMYSLTSCFIRKEHTSRVYDVVLQLLISGENDLVIGELMTLLIPSIVSFHKSSENQFEMFSQFWSRVVAHFDTLGKSDTIVMRALFILCGLLEIYLTMDDLSTISVDLINSRSIWTLIQLGFCHSDSLARKRALYIFRRILDFSTSNADLSDSLDVSKTSNNLATEMSLDSLWRLRNIWQEFILLVEMLEEKQVHVIMPILSRFNKLVDATKVSSKGPSMHTSWLVTIYVRMSTHESVLIKRWAVTSVFTLDLAACPLLQQDGAKFLSSQFIPMLLEPAIYYRTVEDMAEGPNPVAKLLTPFFNCVNANLPVTEQGPFWSAFVSTLSSQNWDGSSLVFVTCSLALLSETGVITHVEDFRHLLSSRVKNLHVLQRTAIQCFTLRAFTNLIDCDTLSINDLALVMGSVDFEEPTFRRGSDLWCHLANWLKTKQSSFVTSQQTSFVKSLHETVALWLQNASNADSAPAFARLIILSADAGLLKSAEQINVVSLLQNVLVPVIDVLQSAGSHVYIPKLKIDRAMALWADIGNVLGSGSVVDHRDDYSESFSALCRESAESVLYYIARCVSEIVEKKVENLPSSLYSSIIRCFSSHIGVENFICMSSTVKLLEFILMQLTVLTKNEPMLCCGMEILASVCSFLPCKSNSIITQKLRLFLNEWKTIVDRPSNGYRGFEWSSFLQNQWICIAWGVKASTPSADHCNELIDAAENTFDVAGPTLLVTCFNALTSLLPKATDEVAERVLRCAWRKVLDFHLNSLFRAVFTTFIGLTYHDELVKFSDSTRTTAFQVECFNYVLDLGEDKVGLVNVLVRVLRLYSTRHGVQHLTKFAACFAKCVLFGPSRGKASRLFTDVYKYLSQLSFFRPQDFYDHSERDDSTVRASILGLLTNSNDTDRPQRIAFGFEVVQNLITLHRTALSKSSRCYANSDVHRRSNRTMSALLLLDEYIPDRAEDHFEYLIEVLERETQPSVRQLVEWILIRQINTWPNLLPALWQHFNEASERKASLLCSLCLVVAHIGKLLTSDLQTHFISTALSRLLPWCMMSNFNIRTFAQASLKSLWRFAEEKKLQQVLTEFSVLQSIDSFMLSNRDCCQAVLNLMDNYCFAYHPLLDFSIEMVLGTAPRLTGMADDEWISVDAFLAVNTSWYSSRLPLRSPSDSHYQSSPPGSWKVKQPGGRDVDQTINMEPDGNVQRKMVPWRSLMPNINVEEESSQSSRQQKSGFVLVTSLIDRPPNLGGLCRTCEIFGVSKFIIGNMRYTDDKNFESLSVTSQKWINIEEVRSDRLRSYLLEMKSRGYTLVGAEQTTSGQKLDYYRFPQQTMLVLGNEKTGIPVEILQVLDVCVEIPQRGVIRSLNVHVSGALFIWEYFKQWSLNTTAEAEKTYSIRSRQS